MHASMPSAIQKVGEDISPAPVPITVKATSVGSAASRLALMYAGNGVPEAPR